MNSGFKDGVNAPRYEVESLNLIMEHVLLYLIRCKGDPMRPPEDEAFVPDQEDLDNVNWDRFTYFIRGFRDMFLRPRRKQWHTERYTQLFIVTDGMVEEVLERIELSDDADEEVKPSRKP